MAISVARSPGGRLALGLGLAALAQFLSVFLAGAGHGWTTPFFISAVLWVLIPIALYALMQDGTRAKILLAAIVAIGLGADTLLVGGTMRESSALRDYVRVNGAAAWLIIVLWLTLLLFWQGLALRTLLHRQGDRDA